ncbi:MAG: glycoside hydrolase family 2 [Clostridia bacterium]|nr:glycoside hydrolase family 2 [Clostridia bacterium]
MKKQIIGGPCKLYLRENDGTDIFDGAQCIEGSIPGNVEIDMMRAGILPDIYFGENVLLLKEYEYYDYKYELNFDAPDLNKGERAYLKFEGVDCFADYFLNGKKFAHSENSLVEHRFDITDIILCGKKNTLSIIIYSPMIMAENGLSEGYESAYHINFESLRVRKAPHMYGWDIMPRILSAGIWRDISLEIEEENEIGQLYITTVSADKDSAKMALSYTLKTVQSKRNDLLLRIEGKSTLGKSFKHDHKVRFVQGRIEFTVTEPDLWWPYGYGEPSLYESAVSLISDGNVIASRALTFGIRTVKLERSDFVDYEGGEFCFLVNGEKIMVKGSNWVPADALHSRDKERYGRMLELFSDTGCNMVRCWGGNVYEDDSFFEKCDRMGIMVWQDFAMACAAYPQEEKFLSVMQEEAEKVVKRLRNHPSIVLWCGDNECDVYIASVRGLDPDKNKITREVLPSVIYRLDPYRPYLPSSPYLSKVAYEKWQNRRYEKNGEAGWPSFLPEDRPWGPRDYYKTPYYRHQKCNFISEIGYHGCNGESSIRSFISEDKLWPCLDNSEWLVHAAEMTGPDGPYAYRIALMVKQVKQLFEAVPDNLSDFILASQISQAEAFKFFIEDTRMKKWERTGILWWNMIDGWPQFSDAVVSYDFQKKLAYYYIKACQQKVCMMLREPDDWKCRLYVSNDTLEDAKGCYKIYDGESGEVIKSGEYYSKANSTEKVCSFDEFVSSKRLIMIEWELGGKKHYNHAILGNPAFSLEKYKKWLNIIEEKEGFKISELIG